MHMSWAKCQHLILYLLYHSFADLFEHLGTYILKNIRFILRERRNIQRHSMGKQINISWILENVYVWVVYLRHDIECYGTVMVL